MKYYFEIANTYFCCSTLSMLNGDIKDIVDSYSYGSYIEHVLACILANLKDDYSKKMPRKIKREYKRMIRLYEFRLKELSWYE